MISAVVELSSQIVVNTIIADTSVDQPPDGCILIDITDQFVSIGSIYDPSTNTFSQP